MSLASNHPSAFIDKESLDTIRRAGAEAEVLNDLHPDQLDLIYRNDWFKMFIPKTYRGLGCSLPAILKVEESLSWADGSTGWVVTLCSGAGWFTGFLQPSLLKEILKNKNVCFAGSGGATGIANMVDGRYEVTGSWRYASGSLHASVFTANCRLHENGLPLHHKDGSPLISAFLFLKEEVTLQREWKSMGMIATASHSFGVMQLVVPSDRCFSIDAKDAVMKDPIYQYPFLQLAETTLTINLSGMAMRFLDLCDPLFSGKMRRRIAAESNLPDLFELLNVACREMDQCRLSF